MMDSAATLGLGIGVRSRRKELPLAVVLFSKLDVSRPIFAHAMHLTIIVELIVPPTVDKNEIGKYAKYAFGWIEIF